MRNNLESQMTRTTSPHHSAVWQSLLYLRKTTNQSHKQACRWWGRDSRTSARFSALMSTHTHTHTTRALWIPELLILTFVAAIREMKMCIIGPLNQAERKQHTGTDRGPRARAHFHFNQSTCWFSWLWALYKQNQMAAPGTGWGTETLGRDMREETYRGGGDSGKSSFHQTSQTQQNSSAPTEDSSTVRHRFNRLRDSKEQEGQRGRRT